MGIPQRTAHWKLASPGTFFQTPGRFIQRELLRQETAATRVKSLLPTYEKHLHEVCRSSRSNVVARAETERHSLTGTWKKNKELSDSMDKAFASVKLPWLYRKAVGFLNYLQIEDDGVHFKTILKAGGVMDVVEQYPWTGDLVTHKRRDKRAGHHEGRVQMSDDGPQLVLEWGEPHAGKGTDTFMLSNGNRLTQVSVMEFADASKNCSYNTVYTRWHGDRN